MPYYEAPQARYFIKHAKHIILWCTPSTPFYVAHQARQFFEACQTRDFIKHAISWSTTSTWARQAREHVKHAKHVIMSSM